MSVLRSKRTITSISFHYMALLTLTDREQSIHTKVVNHNPISQTRVSQYSCVNVIVKGVLLSASDQSKTWTGCPCKVNGLVSVRAS